MLDLFHDCVWFIEFQHPKSPVFNMTFPALMSPTMWLLITHFTEYTMFQCWSDNYKGNNIWFNYEQGDGSVDIAFDSKEWRHFPGNEGLLEPKYVLPFFIHKVLPKLKVIIMLRDPVERYNYNILKLYVFLYQILIWLCPIR